MRDENFSDRRLFRRIPANLSLRFFDQNSNKEGLASTQDISAKGISLLTYEKLVPNSSLEMWLKIPKRDSELYTRGRVVWSEKFGFNQYKAGVDLEKAEFMGMSAILRSIYPKKI